jgi:hypothetical protein
VTRRGVFRPVALVDGRVAATWGLSGGVISITLREPICSAALDALIDVAADVRAFSAFPTALPSSKDPGADVPERVAPLSRGLLGRPAGGGVRCVEAS